MKSENINSTEELTGNLIKILEQYHLIMNKLMDKQSDPSKLPTSMIKSLTEAMNEVMIKIYTNPEKLLEYQMSYINNYMGLINNSMSRFLGEGSQNIYQPDSKDYRFKDPDWQENIMYDFIKQSYIMTSELMSKMVSEVNDIDQKTLSKAQFYTKQIIDALSPSNFVLTNPKVLKETLESNGANLVKGLEQMLKDIEKSNRIIDIATNDSNAFELGVNIATCKGDVIFQNDLIQLIHYTPLKDKNYEIPLLIVPPCINKFYILDLNSQNSCVEWLVSKGYSVYMISWVNPGLELAHKDFQDYITEGIVRSIDVIEEVTNMSKINIIGYCLGGTLLAVTISYLRAMGDTRINNASFMATLVDFSNAGELSVFIDDQQLEDLENRMNKEGYLAGSEMFDTFNLLRANEMIWSFFVNNYLLGKDPIPFDLLYWNSDSTRLPSKMHSFYLRNMYQRNLLIKPAGISINNIGIDLSNIDLDCYFLACKEDHITPWESIYAGIKNLTGKSRFTLSGSGHVGGVINTPNKNKYYYLSNKDQPDSCQDWLKSATNHQGSWWVDWHEWASKKSGKMLKCKDISHKKHKIIESAPGSYVRMK